MANMASVAYAIEGPQKNLEEILGAIYSAVTSEKYWTEYEACINLGFTEEELNDKRLGGEISDAPILENGVLRFYAEERWGLQDFEELIRQKFPDIKVYWTVEESGCDVYCSNDKEGKYFPDRFYADICVDGDYYSEYFVSEDSLFKWLSNITHREINSFDDIEEFNSDYEDSCEDDENFINVHIFDVDEDTEEEA